VNSANFTFKAPPAIARARRVLIKPHAGYPAPYPVTTSRHMLSVVIEGIRRVSDADIIILDGTPDGSPIYPVYQALGYDFPRILMLDVKDCIWVEVDNPLTKPLVMPTFWVPNVILSSDYLISLAPLKVIEGRGHLGIMNLLSLLPVSKYCDETGHGWGMLDALGIDQVLADLYFTLPFDMGIIEARQKFTAGDDPVQGKIEELGKVFHGEPYEVDCEIVRTLGIPAGYLDLIDEAGAELEE
jgi:hypothetical protein